MNSKTITNVFIRIGIVATMYYLVDVNLNHHSSRLKYEKALQAFLRRDTPEMLSHLRSAYIMDKNNKFINETYCKTLAKHNEKGAIQTLKEIISQSPHPNYFVALGRNYLRNEKFDSADYCFTQAHYAQPFLLTPLYWKAKNFYAQGDNASGDSIALVVINKKPKVKSASTILLKQRLKKMLKNS